MRWINSIIKKNCVSCWTAYILQDDTRSLQCQVNHCVSCVEHKWEEENAYKSVLEKAQSSELDNIKNDVTYCKILHLSHVVEDLNECLVRIDNRSVISIKQRNSNYLSDHLLYFVWINCVYKVQDLRPEDVS